MLFSVIMPVYNSESYLNEAIDSVINQTLSFEKNVELILVNDGSEDGSHDICLEYKNKYPQNIKYKEILNSGPGKARNIGMELISPNSNYITFLDADDKLELNVLEYVNQFFEVNRKVNIAVVPVYYFEKGEGPHKLNYRFEKGSRVINIREEYNSPHFYIGGVFINQDFLKKGRYQFNEGFMFWEDAIFVNEMILADQQYGVVPNTKYWYRKRFTEDSLVDSAWSNKYRYTKLLKTGYSHLINLSLKYYKVVLPYVQYLLVYHMKLFIFQKNSNKLMETLDDKEKEEFIEAFKEKLLIIEDKYILEQDIKSFHKDFLLKLKKGFHFTLEESVDNINPFKSIKVTKRKLGFGWITLRGYFNDPNYTLKKEDRIFIRTSNNKIYAKPYNPNKQIKIWGITAKDFRYSGFLVKIPMWYWHFQFGLKTKEETVLLKKINVFNKFVHLKK
jgi:glycosyltransferase involved in cell wall biosynthesis